jgi:hypothetical protein
MAITTIQFPEFFAPAYKPVEWKFRSNKFPNIVDDVNLPIWGITVADQQAVNGIPGLNLGDVFMVLSGNASPASFVAGQTIAITGSTAGRYDGVVRILSSPQASVYVLDTEVTDGSVGGTAALYYENYALFVTVQFAGVTPLKTFRLDPAPDGTFAVDIRDYAQRIFADVFDRVNADTQAGIVDTTGATAAAYSIQVTEGYNMPQSGVNEYRLFPTKFVMLGGKYRVVVNSIQPYHHVNEWTGVVDLDWNRNLQDYIMRSNTIGPNVKRFLTYAPDWDGGERGVLVGADEAYFLSFLAGEPGRPLRLTVQYYNGSAFISEQQIEGVMPIASGAIPCGPRNLNVPAGTTRYLLSLRDGPTNNVISRIYQFFIDYKCHKAPRRLYALNKFGAIDAFTFTGYEQRENGNAPQVVRRDTMPMRITTNGSYQRRTWANAPARLYSIISQTLTKAWLRYVADEILESPDIRTQIQEPIGGAEGPLWTPVIMESNMTDLGYQHGRLSISYRFGIDEQVQTR